jgi:DNA primase
MRSADGDTLHNGASVDHHPASTVRLYQVQRVPATASIPNWQREEVAALKAASSLIYEALASSRRAQRYLDERGIPPAIALACGVGYLSRSAWERALVPDEQKKLLKRWIGRVIFPLYSPDGQGFIGRTLLKWEPGMNEQAHKALLDQPGAPMRWVKTNPAGWFGFDSPACLAEWIILVEGGFDRLALLSAGFPPTSVIALVGTAARPSWLRQLAPQVKGVLLALDADKGGKTAMERLSNEFQQARLTVSLCPPPHDRWGKDWSERWRRLGPQSMWPLYEAFSQYQTTIQERK